MIELGGKIDKRYTQEDITVEVERLINLHAELSRKWMTQGGQQIDIKCELSLEDVGRLWSMLTQLEDIVSMLFCDDISNEAALVSARKMSEIYMKNT